MIDLRPAADRVAALVTSVTDDQLGLPTPCGDYSVGQLVDHLDMFAQRFVAVARKETVGNDTIRPPTPAVEHLENGWRERIVATLAALADAWSDPQAWEGMTSAGGLELPGGVAGNVAIDELVVHGWDLATATGQPFAPTDEEVAAARAFVDVTTEMPRDGSLFGPMVDVTAGAPPLDVLLGLAGRDPSWRPAL